MYQTHLLSLQKPSQKNTANSFPPCWQKHKGQKTLQSFLQTQIITKRNFYKTFQCLNRLKKHLTTQPKKIIAKAILK
jgi:hypothetical protein